MHTLNPSIYRQAALGLLITMIYAATASAGGKTAICHYSEEEGSWKSVSIGDKAAVAHMNNHDDAVPGGYTTMSGTNLDEECAVKVECPCNFDISTATSENWSDANYTTRPGNPSGYGCSAIAVESYAVALVDSQNGYCSLEVEAADFRSDSPIDPSDSAEAIQCAADLDVYMAALADNGVIIDRDLVNGEDVFCQDGVADNP